MTIDIVKSNLLARLIYRQEEFRTISCPQHQEHWTGLFTAKNLGCNHGCDATGCLPANMTTKQIKEMLESRRQKKIKIVKEFIQKNPKSPFNHPSFEEPEKIYKEYKERHAKELEVTVKLLELSPEVGSK